MATYPNKTPERIERFVAGINRGPFYVGKNMNGNDGIATQRDRARTGVKSSDIVQGSASDICQKGKLGIYLLATDQAYLDANRTMKGVDSERGRSAKEGFAKQLKMYFDGAPPDQDSFDAMHAKWCEGWVDSFAKDELRYGQAQKIVNMAFKYLYCCDDIRSEKKAHFRWCHMPLDSLTLNWCKCASDANTPKWNNDPEGLNKKWSAISWSKLDGKEYRDLARKIRKHIEARLSPTEGKPNALEAENVLEAEFDIWETERRRSAASNILKSLENDFACELAGNQLEEMRRWLESFSKAPRWPDERQGRATPSSGNMKPEPSHDG